MQDFFRGRRLRQTPQMRDFFRETPPVLVEDLIMPYFVVETEDQSLEKEIGTMPGQYDLSLTKLEEHVTKAVDNGLRNVILFRIRKYHSLLRIRYINFVFNAYSNQIISSLILRA